MEQWEKSYYISALAGANNGSSFVVMSKGNFNIFFRKNALSLCTSLLTFDIILFRYTVCAAVL